ncbi:FAD-dependent monooxygenase [Fluviicola sp.]|uniref:FAD-dependent monooxygenase n=1 Tax=Fluviicola sp. TaxID=1917219 RepID=UPI003D2B994F
MDSFHEISIVGGGPSGIATALSLLKRGLKSTVFEADATTRPKSGETLPPTVMPVFKYLEIEALLNDPRHAICFGNSWLWGSTNIQDKHFMLHSGGNGWHLQREIFEEALISLAEERGIRIIRNAKIRQVDPSEKGWKMKLKVNNSETTVETGFIVDATGRSSKIARCLGVERQRYDTLVGVVGRFFVDESFELSQQTHIEAVENGWWYAAALSNKQIVTAFMTDAELLPKNYQNSSGYWDALTGTTLIRSLFPEHFQPEKDMVLHTQSAETSFLESIYGENWLAVGDAAFAYDPISSYGITSALGTGCYAGNAIADHLSGAAEALPAYSYLTEKAFSDYLPLWDHQYALEQRWSEFPFWKKRISPEYPV